MPAASLRTSTRTPNTAWTRRGWVGRRPPIAWDLARPTDPDVADYPRRLLRAIQTSITNRDAIRAAHGPDPPDGRPVSATPVATPPPDPGSAPRTDTSTE